MTAYNRSRAWTVFLCKRTTEKSGILNGGMTPPPKLDFLCAILVSFHESMSHKHICAYNRISTDTVCV